jgi:hypothetical protein
MGNWLQIVWNMGQSVLLRKQGMLVLDASEGQLTLDANL